MRLEVEEELRSECRCEPRLYVPSPSFVWGLALLCNAVFRSDDFDPYTLYPHTYPLLIFLAVSIKANYLRSCSINCWLTRYVVDGGVLGAIVFPCSPCS